MYFFIYIIYKKVEYYYIIISLIIHYSMAKAVCKKTASDMVKLMKKRLPFVGKPSLTRGMWRFYITGGVRYEEALLRFLKAVRKLSYMHIEESFCAGCETTKGYGVQLTSTKNTSNTVYHCTMLETDAGVQISVSDFVV